MLQVQIIQLDEDRGEFVLKATFDHPYPTTKIMWIPDQVNLIIRIIVKNFPFYVSTCIGREVEGGRGEG